METIRRTLKQCGDIFLSMSSSQRMSLIVVTAVIIGGFGFLMMGGTSGSYQPLFWDKALSTEELINAEQTLITAGLKDFRREGNRLFIPAGEADRYNAALLEGGSIPDDWGSELLKQLEQNSILTSSEQIRARKEAILAKHLRRVIRAISTIDDAHIVWAPSKQRRFSRGGSKVTATVYVKPRRGHDLDMQLVQGLRVGVASSVPDLKPTDVVIFDQVKGKAYTADADSAFDSKLLTHIRNFEKMYFNKIDSALSYIDDVLITVNVDLEKVKSSVRRTQKLGNKSFETSISLKSLNDTSRQQPNRGEGGTRPNQPRNLQTTGGNEKTRTTIEKEEGIEQVPTDIMITEEQLIGAMPEAVQVSVAIPEDYYRAVALKQGLTEGASKDKGGKDPFQDAVAAIKQTVTTDVQSIVMRNIPNNSVAANVSVISYTPVDREIPEPTTSITETVGNIFSRWGGAIALGFFALWTLWMLNKSMVKLPNVEETTDPELTVHAPVEEVKQKKVEIEDIQESSVREELQLVVRDSPELTASVLTKWIQQES